MPIPHHFSKVVSALKDELDKGGGVGKTQDIIEKLAQYFQVTPAEREIRDPSGMKTFDHRVHAAVKKVRTDGDIEPWNTSGRGIWKLTSKYWTAKRKGELGHEMAEAIVEETLARDRFKRAKDALDKLE